MADERAATRAHPHHRRLELPTGRNLGKEAMRERERERERESRSEKQAAALLLLLLREKGGPRGVLEHFTDALVRLGRAFEVLVRVDLFGNLLALDKRRASAVPRRRLATVMYGSRGRKRIRGREEERSKTGRRRRTCSVETGFCEVLCSSSIVFGSYRRSFLQPTRMMGSPWQKWRTSEIH